MIRHHSLLIALSALAGGWVASPAACALDLGAVGPLHAIAEPNAIEFIKAKLTAMQKSGELAKWQEESKQRAFNTVRNPPAVTGLARTTSPRTFYFDPTYTVPKDIVGPDGRLMYAAGFKANPLQVMSLSQHLLFFDARDAQQVQYAQELMNHYEGRVKPILVAGSPLDLMRDWKVHVYFDQGGTLTTRFGITQVPALVSQDGLQLRVDELKVKVKG